MSRKLKTVNYNGLEFVLVELPNTNYFKMSLSHNMGSEIEAIFKNRYGKEVWGLTHLLEHLGFKSSRDFTTAEIKEVTRNKGYYNAHTWHNDVVYWLESTASNHEDVINAMVNVYMNDLTKVSDEEFVNERSVVCNEIKMYKDNKMTIYRWGALPIVMGQDLNDNVIGDDSLVSTLTKEDIVKLKALAINTPSSARVYMAYDPLVLDEKDILEKVYSKYDSFKDSINLSDGITSEELSLVRPIVRPIGTIIHPSNGLEQTSFEKYLHIDDIPQNYILFNLAVKYLLLQPTGHSLYELIRDREGLSYYIRLNTKRLRQHEYIVFSTEITTGETERLVKTLRESITKSIENINEDVFNLLKESNILKTSIDSMDQTSYFAFASMPLDEPELYSRYKELFNSNIDEAVSKIYEDITYDDFKNLVEDIGTRLLEDGASLIITNTEYDEKKK